MVYPITKHVLSTILKPWVGKYAGIENVPKNSGAILAANHASYLDHFVLGGPIVRTLNKPVYFLAKKEHFDTPIQRWWHKYLKAIPIDREEGGTAALATAIEHLKKGDLIMIYPEGTRTLTGEMNRAKTGVARLALAAHVPVIPVGITNTFHILPKGKNIPKFGKKAEVHFGKPLHFDAYYGKENDKEALRAVTTTVMNEIAKLANKTYNFDQESHN